MDKENSIYVSGADGLLGSAVCKVLKNKGYQNILTKNHAELDLTNQSAVMDFFAEHRPDYQIICAATTGSIAANKEYPGYFIGKNLMLQTNLLYAGKHFDCASVFIASNCIYPLEAPQPYKEDCLLTGLLDREDEFYSMAKIAGVKMTQAFRRQHGIRMASIIPPSIYGPEDVFDDRGHFIPALISRAHHAKENDAPSLRVWGRGHSKRDYIYSEDVAKFIVLFMEKDFPEEIINVSSGIASSTARVAESIKSIVGYDGNLEYDASMPEGAPSRTLCCERMKSLGWKHEIGLEQGLQATYEWFLENQHRLRRYSVTQQKT